jgi:DNA mismatch repair protein MutL
VSHAVHSAYEHLLTKGSFPFFLLFLDIDPHRIDVNVHPSKMEAKFDDEQGVHRFIASLVRKALADAGAVPAMSAAGDMDGSDIGLRFTSRQHAWAPAGGGAGSAWDLPPREQVDRSTGEIFRRDGAPPMSQAEILFGPAPQQPPVQQSDAGIRDDVASQLLWQLHDRYIFSQIRNGVMIVDQHVAHERILYERSLERFEKGMRTSQQLLFPCTIELSPGDYALFEELAPHFEALGFDAKPFGKHTVLVEGVPVDVKPGHEQNILQEMLEQYKEYQQHAPTDVRDNMAKAYACKSAIKAGDPLTEKEMRSLIDQLFATSMPYVCPHGRPVVLRISTEELDRRFGRR